MVVEELRGDPPSLASRNHEEPEVSYGIIKIKRKAKYFILLVLVVEKGKSSLADSGGITPPTRSSKNAEENCESARKTSGRSCLFS